MQSEAARLEAQRREEVGDEIERRKRQKEEEKERKKKQKADRLCAHFCHGGMLTCVSAHLQLDEAIQEGWRNVTAHVLRSRLPGLAACEAKLAPSRSGSNSRKELFLAVYGEDTIEYLRGQVEAQAQLDKGKHAKKWRTADMHRIFSFFVRMLACGTPDLDNHARSERPGEVKANRLAGFRKHLSFDVPTLFRMLSSNMQKQVSASGTACLDETIWPWTGSYYAIVFVPRKPNPEGVKAITLCVKLTRSGRSFCVQVVPDVSQPRLDPPTALGMAVRTMRSLGLRSLIADAWFGSLHAVHHHEDIYVTFSVSAARATDIFPVFHHQLVVPQYHVFAKEDRVVSIFADAAILSVVSTLFEVTALVRNDYPVISGATLATAPRLSQISDAPPRFSPAFRDMLLAYQQLPRSDITSLAVYLGEAKGMAPPRWATFLIGTDGTREDLINRICRIPAPHAPAAAAAKAPAAANVDVEQESA